jgi:hypothetical protein
MTVGLVGSSRSVRPVTLQPDSDSTYLHTRLVNAALTNLANRYHPSLTWSIWACGFALDQAEMPLAGGGGLGPPERFCLCGTWLATCSFAPPMLPKCASHRGDGRRTIVPKTRVSIHHHHHNIAAKPSLLRS